MDLHWNRVSTLVSLGLFLLGLPLLFKARLVISDLFLILLLAALIAEAKISVGLLFAGLWLVRWLFIRGERPAFERIAALSAVVAAAFVMSGAIGAMSGWVMIGPHHILRLLLNFVHVFPFGDAWVSEVIAALRAGADIPWRISVLATMVTLSFLVFHFFSHGS